MQKLGGLLSQQYYRKDKSKELTESNKELTESSRTRRRVLSSHYLDDTPAVPRTRSTKYCRKSHDRDSQWFDTVSGSLDDSTTDVQSHTDEDVASLVAFSKAGLTGVTYDFTSRAWRASYRDEYKRLVYVGHFTIKMFGNEDAKELAILAKLNCNEFKRMGKEEFRAWVIERHKALKKAASESAREKGTTRDAEYDTQSTSFDLVRDEKLVTFVRPE